MAGCTLNGARQGLSQFERFLFSNTVAINGSYEFVEPRRNFAEPKKRVWKRPSFDVYCKIS